VAANSWSRRSCGWLFIAASLQNPLGAEAAWANRKKDREFTAPVEVVASDGQNGTKKAPEVETDAIFMNYISSMKAVGIHLVPFLLL
jgi:hypothetical protein